MQHLLGQTPDGLYLYQCSCGAVNALKKQLRGKKHLRQCKECSDHRVAGGIDHPLYKSWNKDYRKLWPKFEEFLIEVTPWPGPRYMLTGLNGPHASPGNAQWVERPKQLFPIHYDTMRDFKGEFYDDALKRLHEEAHRDITIGPDTRTAFLAHLSRLEVAGAIDPNVPIETQQIQREKESQLFAIERKKLEEEKAHEQRRSSQTAPARSIRNKLVPLLALRMEEHYKTAMKSGIGTNLDVVHPLVSLIPWDVMAHITVTVVLDLLGRGTSFHTPLTTVHKTIGERLDHQAFFEHVCRYDPQAWDKIDRWYLQDDVMGYTAKVRNAQATANVDGYAFMGPVQRVQVGNWAWANLQSITDWFDALRWWDSQNARTYYLGLSRTGLRYAALITKMQEEHSFDCWPMICPPQPWERDQRGGYLKFHPSTAQMVRNDRGTSENVVPSDDAIAALNKMQSIPFKLNAWIYGIQKLLSTKTDAIGSFIPYEADSYKELHYPLIDPQVWELPRLNGGVHPEIQKAKRKLKRFHANSKKAEKMKTPLERVLRVAARFVGVPEFYLPAFMDSRTRMYYMVDTLNPQGSDFQKALLLAARGNPVTDANREMVRADLLYTLANNWAGKVEGETIKSDKLATEERIEFGRKLAKEGLQAVKDPTSSDGRSFWTAADEPFQFLATLHEYHSIFNHQKLGLSEPKRVAEVLLGRDASNSGMQIQGGFLRDHKMCKFTNVLPSYRPMDAYEECAVYVRQFCENPVWIGEQMEKCAKSAERNEKARQEQDPDYKMKDKNFTFNVEPSEITRKILKRASMTTLYGAAFQSKYDYIAQEMDALGVELGKDYSIAEKLTVTNAQVKGQKAAFPKSAEIDDWFRKVGGLVLKKGDDNHYVRWQTAAGSLCVQEYREPITKAVNAYGMGGARYFEVLETDDGKGENTFAFNVKVGYGDVKESKTQSALAANWTHSQDASIIQFAFKDYPHAFYAVHDCGYTCGGVVGEMVQSLKKAYLKVVSSPVLDNLPAYNNIQLDGLEKGTVNILDCLKSDHMFG